jgi:hypothetical protein
MGADRCLAPGPQMVDAMKEKIRNFTAEFDARHEDKVAYSIAKLLGRAFLFIARITYKVFVFFFAVFIMRTPPSTYDHPGGLTHQDDRGADDTWKLSSGNDYYDKEPPGPFS